MSRGTDTGFGICDLPQESTIKAKIRPLGQNRDFLGPFLDLFGTFSRYLHENAKRAKNELLSQHFQFQNISNGQYVQGDFFNWPPLKITSSKKVRVSRLALP